MQLRNLILSALLIIPFCTHAQLFVKMERLGSPDGKRIYPGHELVFKIAGGEEWRVSELIEIIPESDILVFADQAYSISEIKLVREDSRSSWSAPLGNGLFTFGVSWSFYAGAASIFDDTFTYSKRDAIIGGSTILAGLGIRRLFRYKTLDIGKKYKLRIIDMRL